MSARRCALAPERRYEVARPAVGCSVFGVIARRASETTDALRAGETTTVDEVGSAKGDRHAVDGGARDVGLARSGCANGNAGERSRATSSRWCTATVGAATGLRGTQVLVSAQPRSGRGL